MSDTRTIYLKNNEGTIYSSDPSNVRSEYLDMSGFDSLNPSENSIFTSVTNIQLMYSSYDVKLVLTFMSDYDNGRQARAQWIAKNQNSSLTWSPPSRRRKAAPSPASRAACRRSRRARSSAWTTGWNRSACTWAASNAAGSTATRTTTCR